MIKIKADVPRPTRDQVDHAREALYVIRADAARYPQLRLPEMQAQRLARAIRLLEGASDV